MPWDHRRALAGLTAAVIVSLVSLLVVGLLTGETVPLWAALSATLVLQIAFVAIAVRLGPGNSDNAALLFGPRRLTTLPQFGWAAAALLGSLILSAAYVAVATRISPDLEPSPLPIELDGTGVRWFAFLVVVVIGPAAEEVFFRGFLFAGFLKALSPPLAVLASAVVFAVAHLDVTLLGPAFFSGVVFAVIYWHTGSLWTVIFAHTAQNAMAFAISG